MIVRPGFKLTHNQLSNTSPVPESGTTRRAGGLMKAPQRGRHRMKGPKGPGQRFLHLTFLNLLSPNHPLSVLPNEHQISAVPSFVRLALLISQYVLFPLNVVVPGKEATPPGLPHDGTAEPSRVSPPEAVVYLSNYIDRATLFGEKGARA